MVAKTLTLLGSRDSTVTSHGMPTLYVSAMNVSR